MKNDTVRIWDLPTRLFHWGLVAATAGLFLTAYGPGTWFDWHPRLGYAVLALLLFRFVWGLVGGHWSRFANFVVGPRAILAYLRDPSSGGRSRPGHNPLGALAVMAMLAGLSVQVATGLISDDEIAFTGPLNRFVSTAEGLAATAWHKDWGQWLIVGLITLHVLAIALYRIVRKERLVGPMLHGNKALPAGTTGSMDDARSRVLALVILAGCAGAVWWLVRLAPLA